MKRLTLQITFSSILLILLAATVCSAQTSMRYSINAGGSSSSEGGTLMGSIGQSVAGSSDADTVHLGIGLWYVIDVGDDPMCECGVKGDVDGDADCDPVDVIYLVNFVYKNLDGLTDRPECPLETGDLDCGGGKPTPVDVVYLVNYVYKAKDAICDACNQ